MTAVTTTPRIRICYCPICSTPFKWQRHSQQAKKEGLPPLQICPACYVVLNGPALQTVLVTRDEWSGRIVDAGTQQCTALLK